MSNQRMKKKPQTKIAMKSTDIIYLSISDLNYQGVTTGKGITRAEFFRTKYFDGRYLRQRCSFSRYQQIERETHARTYDLAIQKKYNVGSNWRNNRWFVEQVRPTL